MSGPSLPPPPPFPGPSAARPGARSPRADALRARRLRRRALMLLLPVPLLVAALVLGLKLAFLPVTASYASDRYEARDYTEAATSFGLHKTMNVVDPWKAWFNTGTASHRAGDDSSAITDLHRAYDLAEDEEPLVRCQVQVNLSIAYETSGDFEKTTGDDYLAQKEALEGALAARDAGEDYDKFLIDPSGTGTELVPQDLQDEATTWYSYAERSYATAEQVRGWPGCEDQPPPEKEQNEESVQRLQDKQQEAKDAQPQEPAAPQDEQGEEPPPETEQGEQERAEAERQEKLQQQNSEARDDEDRSRQEYQQYFGGEDPADGTGDGGGSSKNW